MKEAGILLIALGVVACGVAFFITTSSHVYQPSLPYSSLTPYMPSMPSDVVNLWGLHVQALIFQGGFAAIIAGSVLYGFGTVDETLKQNSGTVPKPAPAPAPPPPPPPAVPVHEEYEVEEEKPDHSMIWIALAGLGITAIIILAILAAQQPTTGATNNVDTNMDGNVEMDTNATTDNFFATPRTTRRRH